MERGGFVYMMTTCNNTALYTGVISDLYNRVINHKEKHFTESFTSKYNINKLVYYCFYSTIEEAIAEEKRIKGGSRLKKIVLIESMNVEWRDLWEDIKDW